MLTRMTLQLANRSITRPYGVIEDVLVRVKHLIFPADFIVMDIEDDANIPLILGRPFMSIASCIVDKGKKQLEMGIEDTLDVRRARKNTLVSKCEAFRMKNGETISELQTRFTHIVNHLLGLEKTF